MPFFPVEKINPVSVIVVGIIVLGVTVVALMLCMQPHQQVLLPQSMGALDYGTQIKHRFAREYSTFQRIKNAEELGLDEYLRLSEESRSTPFVIEFEDEYGLLRGEFARVMDPSKFSIRRWQVWNPDERSATSEATW